MYLQTDNVVLDKNFADPYDVAPGKYVKISVTDTGTGMDEATQQKIFEPFFTTRKKGKGTGLGLASVYRIIKNHGGFVDVFSKISKGSTFNIFLPASENKVVNEKYCKKEFSTGAGTILLVDDEEMILEAVKNALKKIGYNVFSARNGKEAIKFYNDKQSEIDLVILDLIMPEISGMETYAELKEINPDIQVLFISGMNISNQKTELLDSISEGFIKKPFGIEVLSNKIRSVVKKQTLPK